MALMKYWQAIRLALREEMERDPSVCLFGEDVGAPGGAFGASQGLQNEFGDLRVRDTPISEGAIAGMAVGSALTGMRPVAEIMFMDFLTLAMDQLVNQAAKMRYMSAGKFSVPLTIRTVCGAHRGSGPQHSQALEGWLASVPGLKVVTSATPRDAKGLLKAAIRSDDPVIVIENLSLWGQKGDVPEDPELVVPLGRASVEREGDDVTLVAWGAAVGRARAAAETLALGGVSAEVIDLRSLSPLDDATILQSLQKTGRIVIIQDAVAPCSVGADVLRVAVTAGFALLQAQPIQLAPPFAPVPFPEVLMRQYYPQAEDVVSAVSNLLQKVGV